MSGHKREEEETIEGKRKEEKVVVEETRRGEKELRLNEGRRGNKDREGDSIKDKRRHEDTWCGNEKGRT